MLSEQNKNILHMALRIGYDPGQLVAEQTAENCTRKWWAINENLDRCFGWDYENNSCCALLQLSY